MARIGLAALALLVLGAGCLDSSTISPVDDEGATAAPDLSTMLADLPCEAPYDDVGTTENLRQLSFTEFDGESGPQEIDVAGDLLLAARDMGFSTVDVSNPLLPVVMGHYGDAAGMLDVKFTPDNLTALVGSYDNIDLVDVRDPAEPRQVGRWTFDQVESPPSGVPGQNAHMVFPARIAGEDWVFLAPQSSTGVWVLKLTGTPDERSLEFVTTTMPIQGGQSGPHDIFVQYDELLQTWILYTADAFLGWTAFDVSDPANPELMVAVPNADFSGTHSVQAALVGGRRIVATTTEFGMNALKFWDATDLARPVQVGYWTHELGPGIYDHQHNINIVEGRLYMAHYALGLYVFDLTLLPASPAGALSIQPVAHYAKLQETGLGAGANGGFWDLVLHEGLLYAGVYSGGVQQGLHVIGYGCLTPGDPLQTSVG
ncbi:MAG TPA: hypothetical protein VM327_10125 [Candidatus Thermoplasmatota archaeon]|nr:hypothetical protein [Candidatus Thermoplasmatota archaeon]